MEKVNYTYRIIPKKIGSERMFLFWYWLIWVVPDKGPLNGLLLFCIIKFFRIKEYYCILF